MPNCVQEVHHAACGHDGGDHFLACGFAVVGPEVGAGDDSCGAIVGCEVVEGDHSALKLSQKSVLSYY